MCAVSEHTVVIQVYFSLVYSCNGGTDDGCNVGKVFKYSKGVQTLTTIKYCLYIGPAKWGPTDHTHTVNPV